MATRKRKLLEKLKDRYKLVILNDETFEEKASFTLNRISVFIAASVVAVALILLTTALLVFTPLKEYIPGFNDLTLHREVTETAYKADSLEAILYARQAYLENIRNIIDGTVGDTLTEGAGEEAPAPPEVSDLGTSDADAAFREYIENQDRYDISPGAAAKVPKSSIGDYTFFPPVQGIVTGKFDMHEMHYGTDIACQKDESIKATLDGMVVFAGFTTETGNVIAIQHAGGIISLYKHCSVIFKKVGSFVRSGEALGVVGNTGELSSGPHLHLEIWYNGAPVDPAGLMRF